MKITYLTQHLGASESLAHPVLVAVTKTDLAVLRVIAERMARERVTYGVEPVPPGPAHDTILVTSEPNLPPDGPWLALRVRIMGPLVERLAAAGIAEDWEGPGTHTVNAWVAVSPDLTMLYVQDPEGTAYTANGLTYSIDLRHAKAGQRSAWPPTASERIAR